MATGMPPNRRLGGLLILRDWDECVAIVSRHGEGFELGLPLLFMKISTLL